MSHDWKDRLGTIRFKGTFKVRGAETVQANPAVIDPTLDDEPPVVASAPDAPAAADAPIPVVTSSDGGDDAMAAANNEHEPDLSAKCLVPTNM